MSKLLEQQLTDWTLWFNYNYKTLPKADLLKRVAFLEKALEGCLECLLIAAKDIKNVEGVRRQLYMPAGVSLLDDFGRPLRMRTEDNNASSLS